MKQKKILYLRTDIYDKELIAGGSVSHTLGVINGFTALGYEVFCASSLMLQILRTTKLASLKKLYIPRICAFLLRWKMTCLFSNFLFTLQTLLFIKKHKIDFIYQRYSILNAVGIILSKIKKIPLILEYNGSEVWVNDHWSQKKKFFSLRSLINYIEKINLNYAQVIVVVSQPLFDELVARGISAKKILINPNGVDPSLFDPEKLVESREEIRKKLNIDDCCVFGFVGTFSIWHGVEILAYMIPRLIEQRKKVHFLLIGDGQLLPELKESLSKQKIGARYVTYTGLVAHNKAKEYLSACDVFLSPTQPNPDGSRFFGSPTKLFEYMSLAKPIIASELEQLAEIISPASKIQENDNEISEHAIGALVHPGNKEGFVKAATMIIDLDVEKRIHIGNNARKKVCQHYSWMHHVQKIEKFID